MRIKKITKEAIIFDNGNTITYDHEQDCCEMNYADFDQLDDLARGYNFKEDLKFEAVKNAGFRFGDHPSRMFFVPCYSYQTGYYTTEIDIFYNGNKTLHFNCKLDDYE